jgi:hypothetical protein
MKMADVNAASKKRLRSILTLIPAEEPNVRREADQD